MGQWPTQVDEKRLGPATTLYGTVALSFVIPSEAEGSAVPRTFPGNVFRQSVAKWRDLLLLFPVLTHPLEAVPFVRSLVAALEYL
jgi:hypothetical protein